MNMSNKRVIGLSIVGVLMIGLLAYFVYYVVTQEISNSKIEALKPQIVKELNTRYHEAFSVLRAKYNDQSKTYTFIVETDSLPGKQFIVITDLMGKGSFVSNFLQTRQAMESAKLVEGYFQGAAKDFKAVAGGWSIPPLHLPKEQKYLADVALDNLHGKAMHLDEWIKTSHQAMRFGTTIRINLKETPENIIKVLNAVYKLNKYFLSQEFFTYHIDVQLMDLPEKPKYITFPLTTEIFVRQQGGEASKYTWATISVTQCTINGIMKQCYGKPNVPQYADIGKSINNPLDVAKYFRFIPRRTAKADIFGKIEDSWVIKRRAELFDAKWLVDTLTYQQVKALYAKEGD